MPLLLIALALTACHKHTEKGAAAKELPVHVVTARDVSWPQRVTVPATVSAVDTAVLASRAGGWVTKVDAAAGDHVTQGAILAEVGAPEARDRLAEAEARVATAEATLKEATANERRYATLRRTRAVSARQYDAAERNLTAAKAQVAAAHSALAAAKSNLDYAEIRAPFTGVVAEKKVWVGDFAAPGTPLFVVASNTPEIRAYVGPAIYASLKVGIPVHVDIDGKLQPAVLTRVVSAADPATRTHLIELRLQDGAGAPFGAYADLYLDLGPVSPQVAVPLTAVTQRAGLRGVFVVGKDHRVHFRLVRVGESRDGQIAIVAGLAKGETVVTAPTADLVNDALIQPEAAAPAPVGAESSRG